MAWLYYKTKRTFAMLNGKVRNITVKSEIALTNFTALHILFLATYCILIKQGFRVCEFVFSYLKNYESR